MAKSLLIVICAGCSPPRIDVNSIETSKWVASAEEAEKSKAEAMVFLVPFSNPQIKMYRIAGVGDELTRPSPRMGRSDDDFHGFAILAETKVDDRETAALILATLTEVTTYGDKIMTCFDPGIGLSLDEGDYWVDILVCLDCGRLYFCSSENAQWVAIQGQGVRAIAEIYNDVF